MLRTVRNLLLGLLAAAAVGYLVGLLRNRPLPVVGGAAGAAGAEDDRPLD